MLWQIYNTIIDYIVYNTYTINISIINRFLAFESMFVAILVQHNDNNWLILDSRELSLKFLSHHRLIHRYCRSVLENVLFVFAFYFWHISFYSHHFNHYFIGLGKENSFNVYIIFFFNYLSLSLSLSLSLLMWRFYNKLENKLQTKTPIMLFAIILYFDAFISYKKTIQTIINNKFIIIITVNNKQNLSLLLGFPIFLAINMISLFTSIHWKHYWYRLVV